MHKWMTKRQIFIFLQWENVKGDDNFELNDFGIVNMPMNYEKLFTHSSMIKYEKTDDFLGFWYWKLDQHKISFHIPFFFFGSKDCARQWGSPSPNHASSSQGSVKFNSSFKVEVNVFFSKYRNVLKKPNMVTDKGFTKMRVLLTNVLWASWHIDLH